LSTVSTYITIIILIPSLPIPNYIYIILYILCSGHYCADGIKVACPAGRYGDTLGLARITCSGLCQPGYYCPAGSISATEIPCPAGRYGNSSGLQNSACSGSCAAGYHCPSAAISPYALPCGILSITPTTKNSMNIYTLPIDDAAARIQVYYSQFNLTVITQFLSATSGYGLTTSATSTSSSTTHDTTDELDTSLAPSIVVDINSMGEITLSYQNIYQPLTQENQLSPIVSSSQYLVYQLQEPNAVFCPVGSARPLIAQSGYYTLGGKDRWTRTEQMICPIGTYCNQGIQVACPPGTYGQTIGLSSSACSGLCQIGYYCPAGSISAREKLCPLGRYGNHEGLGSATCSGSCLHPLDCPAGSTTDTPIRSV
jgi:hypothetical protein